MGRDSVKERNSKINLTVFIKDGCPQCVIAIDTAKKINNENARVFLNVVNTAELKPGTTREKGFYIVPYFLVDEKFLIPGTASKGYVKNVIDKLV